MKIKILILGVLLLSIFQSCIKEEYVAEEQPELEILSPAPCDTLYFGASFRFKVKISDESGLGNIKMDVHNNFNHHKHGEHEACNFDESKDAVNPYFDDWIFSLPSNEKEYVLDTMLCIPDTSDFDTGDYHFHIYVTDNDGYQSWITMDTKIFSN